jgi:hypothetical protein
MARQPSRSCSSPQHLGPILRPASHETTRADTHLGRLLVLSSCCCGALPAEGSADKIKAALPVLDERVLGTYLFGKASSMPALPRKLTLRVSDGGKIGDTLTDVFGPRAVGILVANVHLDD